MLPLRLSLRSILFPVPQFPPSFFSPIFLAFSSWLDLSCFLSPLLPAWSHCKWEVGQSCCVLRSCGCNCFLSHKNFSYLNFPAVWIVDRWDLISSEDLKTWDLLISMCTSELIVEHTKERRYFSKSVDAKVILSKLLFCVIYCNWSIPHIVLVAWFPPVHSVVTLKLLHAFLLLASLSLTYVINFRFCWFLKT